ncbi:MAG: FKBP-type peptidyl-prolyl cis-trans isomerase [Candidatus Acidiferrales bacterium]
MRKPFIIAVNILAVAFLFLGNARAQQTPPPAAQKTPAMSTAQPPAAKTGQSPETKTQTPSPFETDKEKTSYAIGMDVGSNLRSRSIEVDPDILIKGLRDALAGDKTLMTDEEKRAVLTQLQAKVRAAMAEQQAEARKKQEAEMQVAGEANQKEGQAFLDANKTKDGVVTLPSGLQYKILQAGTGPMPTTTDSVVCNYRGTLINGKEFDSSYKRGQPATFPVSGVIKGWTEALQLMPVGSKWQLYVPADLAYGARGAGADIGPNSTLIFEVDLISIAPKK